MQQGRYGCCGTLTSCRSPLRVLIGRLRTARQTPPMRVESRNAQAEPLLFDLMDAKHHPAALGTAVKSRLPIHEDGAP